jgi:enamine deaminase RidA (YjgF/YER057c/UK114 family)
MSFITTTRILSSTARRAVANTKTWVAAATTFHNQHYHNTNHEQRRGVHVEKRLAELGIVLPKASLPRANYNIVCHASGNMLYISGHLPFQPDGTLLTGRIGEGGRDKDYGYQAARHAGLNIISTLKDQLGDLDRVEQIVKVRVYRIETETFSYYED